MLRPNKKITFSIKSITNLNKLMFKSNLFHSNKTKIKNNILNSQFTNSYSFSSSDSNHNNQNNTLSKSNPDEIKFTTLDEEVINSIQQENIRNFCIIAHIDHGKSTLSDRILEICGVVNNIKKSNQQVLDTLKVERERGITVKAQTASMIYKYKNEKYLLNLIDTPGHVDFSFEVIRSLKPCQGAILLVDATKGVQAQTVANYNHAKGLGIKIIPIINKIDLPGAEILETENQIIENFPNEFPDEESISNILKVSAKTGLGVVNVLDSIIENIPFPKGNINNPFKALLYDMKYVESKGIILYIEVIEGSIKKGDSVCLYSNTKVLDIFEVGIVQPTMTKLNELRTGQVGYVITNMKEMNFLKIGETIFSSKQSRDEIVPEITYDETKSMVYSGIYPSDPSEYMELKKSLEKMQLTDSSIKLENENSSALGAGFRIGFLGLLHLDVFHQRLEDEYEIDVIVTTPSTPYKVKIKDNIKNLEVTYPNVKIRDKDEYNKSRILLVENVMSCPDREAIEYIEEPIIEADIITPREYISILTELVLTRRGEESKTVELSNNFVKISFFIPLSEVMIDFYDMLKSVSKGYASLDYKFHSYRKTNIRICSFLIHNEKLDALSFFAHESQADSLVRKMCVKLSKHLPQQLFAFAIQGKVENKIICREDVKALKKNVTAKCYGGDITRKMKLIDKQKKGKKKMRQLGTVSIDSDTFYNILKDKGE